MSDADDELTHVDELEVDLDRDEIRTAADARPELPPDGESEGTLSDDAKAAAGGLFENEARLSRTRRAVDRVTKGEVVLFSVGPHEYTVNEIHAMVLGLAVGLLTGGLILTGAAEAAVGVASMFAGYAILGRPMLGSLPHDDEAYGTVGLKTIAHEPWYFVGVYALATVGVLIAATTLGVEVDMKGVLDALDLLL